MLALPVLFLVSSFAGNDAVHYYNIYQRQNDQAELPMGPFSLRESMQFLRSCPLPEDMSPLIRGFVRRYRFWIVVFFGDLLATPVVVFLAGHLL